MRCANCGIPIMFYKGPLVRVWMHVASIRDEVDGACDDPRPAKKVESKEDS